MSERWEDQGHDRDTLETWRQAVMIRAVASGLPDRVGLCDWFEAQARIARIGKEDAAHVNGQVSALAERLGIDPTSGMADIHRALEEFVLERNARVAELEEEVDDLKDEIRHANEVGT